MVEYDLIVMSLVIFVPTLFALGLLFFPRGSDEYMRWWSLLGTAITLVVSLWMFIDFQRDVIDFHQSKPEDGSLAARAEAARKAWAAADSPDSEDRVTNYRRRGSDWVASVPWIPRFNINY